MYQLTHMLITMQVQELAWWLELSKMRSSLTGNLLGELAGLSWVGLGWVDQLMLAG